MSFDPVRAEALLVHHRDTASPFQVDQFVIGRSGATPWGRFVQAIRELSNRIDAAKGLDLDIRYEDEKACVEAQEASEKGHNDLAALVLERRERRRLMQQRQLSTVEAERALFFDRAEELRRELPATLDGPTVERLEVERWVAMAQRTATIEILASGRPSQATIEMVCSLPRQAALQVLGTVRGDPGPLVDDFLASLPAGPHAALLTEGGS